MSTNTRGLEHHIVIVGWSERISSLIPKFRNLLSDKDKELKPILIISPNAKTEEHFSAERTYFTYGKPTDIEVLKHAHIDKASAVIIPLPTANNPNEDAQVSLAAIIATSIHPTALITVEVQSEETRKTLIELKNSGYLAKNTQILHLGEVNAKAFAESLSSKV